jgi:hypothetical protein
MERFAVLQSRVNRLLDCQRELLLSRRSGGEKKEHGEA